MRSERPVLHIVPSEPWGGIQALVPVLARAQQATGRVVHLICLGRGRRIRSVAEENGLDAVTTSLAGPTAPLRMMAWLLANRGAIVHTHCIPIWAGMVLATARLLGITQRIVAHGHVYPAAEMTIKKHVSLALHRVFAHRHIAISHSIGRALILCRVATPANLDVVYNGIDAEAVVPAPRAARAGTRIGFVGRVVWGKGIFDFIELAALMPETTFQFDVYGDGEDLSEAQRMSIERGLAHRIMFHGHVDDMARAWANIDLATVFSEREPFGLVFLEAALHGVSTVTYDNDSGGSEIADLLSTAHKVAPGDLAGAAAVARHLAADGEALAQAFAQDRLTIGRGFSVAAMEQGIAGAYARFDAAAA